MTQDIRTIGRPTAGEVRVVERATGSMTVGQIDAVGPDVIGFAIGDRVAYEISQSPNQDRYTLGANALIGVPKNVSDDKVVAFLAPGLIARSLVKQIYVVREGDVVRVDDPQTLLGGMVAAWCVSLGARVVTGADADGEADVSYEGFGRRGDGSGGIRVVRRGAQLSASSRFTRSAGQLQQQAADVFQMIRTGIFDRVSTGFTASTLAA